VPGGRGVNYDFPNGTPPLLVTVFVVFMVNFVADFAVGIWASRWAPRQASTYYSYPLRFKGGIIVYLPSPIGHYLVWGFWTHFLLLGIIGLLFWYYQKTGRAKRYR
jgi:hypothetical protein